jgi:hypothetical protein
MGKQSNNTQPQSQQKGEQDVQDKNELDSAGAGDIAEQGNETSGDQSGDAGNGESGSDSEGTEGAGDSDAGSDAEALAALAALSTAGQGDGATDEGTDGNEDQGGDSDADTDGGDVTEATDEPGDDVQINDAPAATEAPVQGNAASVADAPNDTPVAAPHARIPSVTLNPIPTKVDIKVQQDNLKLTIIASQLQDYATNMHPSKAMNAVDGKANQTALWRTIEMILKLEGPEFIKGFTMLLDWFSENRQGALNERYIYRYFADLTIPNNDRKNFNRILNLLVATADPATRRLGLEQADLTATLSGFRDGAIQQRVTEFYSL